MQDLLIKKLESQWQTVKNAPGPFVFVCFISFIILAISIYGLFETALKLQKSTIDAYKERYGALSAPKNPYGDIFISQMISNFNGYKIGLDYEPLPHTIQIAFVRKPTTPSTRSGPILLPSVVEEVAHVEGKDILFMLNDFLNLTNDFLIRVDYLRRITN